MGKQLAKVVILVSLMTTMSVAMADFIQYTDEAGNMRYEYIKGWTNPDLVISEEDNEILLKNEKQWAREDAIEKIGKASGLSQFEISALKEESRRQFENEIQEEQRNKPKNFNDVRLNSGKVKPAEWTK